MARASASWVRYAWVVALLLAACDKAPTPPAAPTPPSPPAAPAAPAATLYECHLMGGGSATYTRLDPANHAVEEGRDKDKLDVVTKQVIFNPDGVVTWSRGDTNLSFDPKTGVLDWTMGRGQPQKDICKPI